MYRLQKRQFTQQYQQLRDTYSPVLKLVEDTSFEFDQLKRKAKEAGVSPERLQATLEGREKQIERGNFVYRPYPYSPPAVGTLVEIECTTFVSQIEARTA